MTTKQAKLLLLAPRKNANLEARRASKEQILGSKKATGLTSNLYLDLDFGSWGVSVSSITIVELKLILFDQ